MASAGARVAGGQNRRDPSGRGDGHRAAAVGFVRSGGDRSRAPRVHGGTALAPIRGGCLLGERLPVAAIAGDFQLPEQERQRGVPLPWVGPPEIRLSSVDSRCWLITGSGEVLLRGGFRIRRCKCESVRLWRFSRQVR